LEFLRINVLSSPVRTGPEPEPDPSSVLRSKFLWTEPNFGSTKLYRQKINCVSHSFSEDPFASYSRVAMTSRRNFVRNHGKLEGIGQIMLSKLSRLEMVKYTVWQSLTHVALPQLCDRNRSHQGPTLYKRDTQSFT
jgi:hypothetical protein